MLGALFAKFDTFRLLIKSLNLKWRGSAFLPDIFV